MSSTERRPRWPWLLIMTGILLVLLYGGLIWSMPHRSIGASTQKSSTKIIISVPEHKLYLYQNDKLLHTYPVAVGKPATPSPRGDFVVTQKAIWGDGFGTRWIRFSAPWGIYGIHGTNKPWTVGTVASHGCFRMYNRDVEQLYPLISLGTPVIIKGLTPYTSIRRELATGNIGQDVVELQRLLKLAKVYPGPLNGIFSPEVKKSVETFQIMMQLPVTGVASLETTQKLTEYTHEAGKKPGYLARL